MRLTVIIPTMGRRWLLSLLLKHLGRQRRLPDRVIVVAPDASHVDMTVDAGFELMHVFATGGLCAQRNRAMAAAWPHSDILTFFDDDFVPADEYLAEVEKAFTLHSEWTVLTGHVVKDGIKGPGLTFEEALGVLDGPDRLRTEQSARERHGAYGCNMSVRVADVGDARFDERLPLYGWQEDTDFSRRVARGGRIVEVPTMRGVHLGVKQGRLSGLRFGYSQIANPTYLLLKGTVHPQQASWLMARNVVANLWGSIRPEPHIDRRGRLRGNLIGLGHVLRGRVEPEHILKL